MGSRLFSSYCSCLGFSNVKSDRGRTAREIADGAVTRIVADAGGRCSPRLAFLVYGLSNRSGSAPDSSLGSANKTSPEGCALQRGRFFSRSADLRPAARRRGLHYASQLSRRGPSQGTIGSSAARSENLRHTLADRAVAGSARRGASHRCVLGACSGVSVRSTQKFGGTWLVHSWTPNSMRTARDERGGALEVSRGGTPEPAPLALQATHASAGMPASTAGSCRRSRRAAAPRVATRGVRDNRTATAL